MPAPDHEERQIRKADSATLDDLFSGHYSGRHGAQVAMVLAGTLLLALSARVSVPLFAVPMTFQTLVALLLGAALGPRLGAATVGVYLAQGAAGIPVFAGVPEKGIGLTYMAGPTGGYLLGFMLAAFVVGTLMRVGWGLSFVSAAAMMLAGTVAVYVPGLLWLGSIVGWDKPVFAWGIYPFVRGDLLKLAMAMLAVPLVWRIER